MTNLPIRHLRRRMAQGCPVARDFLLALAVQSLDKANPLHEVLCDHLQTHLDRPRTRQHIRQAQIAIYVEDLIRQGFPRSYDDHAAYGLAATRFHVTPSHAAGCHRKLYAPIRGNPT